MHLKGLWAGFTFVQAVPLAQSALPTYPAWPSPLVGLPGPACPAFSPGFYGLLQPSTLLSESCVQ